MSNNSKILIVGGVAGGASAAARLRRLSEHAEIIMFERGDYISFANCGMPYYIGGEIKDAEALTVQTPEKFKAMFNIDIRIAQEVMSIDRSAKTITVKNLRTGECYTESYDKLILSPGAEPIRPKIAGFQSDKIFTLRNISDTLRIKEFIDTRQPRRAMVVGGGYIGLEMAENLHRQGLEVTIVQRDPHVLNPLDDDMACEVHNHIISQGCDLLLSTEVRSVREESDRCHVTLSDHRASSPAVHEIETEMIILAVGVFPESGLAKAAGLETNQAGAIVVNDRMQTSDPDVYAIGDAVEIVDYVTKKKGFIPLAGPANKQGRIAADNIAGYESRYKGTQGTSILRVFDFTVATTGINEKTARQHACAYEKSYTWSTDHANYYPDATNMSIKLIFEKRSGRIFGAQIVGRNGVDKRCDLIASAIRHGQTVFDLTELELCYAPPYSSAKDPVNMAGYVAENIVTKKTNVFHWHDIELLPRDGSVTLVDVQLKADYEKGHIDGFVNIPLEELRKKLDDLDKSKKIYICCQIGLRGYLASRILLQYGFDVANMSGGYRLYRSIFGAK